ncbi:hypothetical protein BKA59DRAFT_200794 [Fusarium tricinctum]|uniref:Zn(2)-C6 fungal-type domain-containing protein n=1 Tax=Fusarium tricinctum TaxID=61284 RepID=A0A8K0RZ35_9HYPO|nr:hypothetical protein BKA59DRAFT_200794 [Fusarium tricinctum]
MVTGPGRPGKACSICKKQKIRCSGERPSCRRCVRLKSECYYDNNVVHVRARRDKTRVTSRIDVSAVCPLQPLAPAASLHVASDFYQGVPPSLVPILIDLYFENVYQSDLLLHKPSFLQALTNQAIRPHILLSICAWGANFYRDDAGKAALKEAGLMTLWAKKAGTLVFQEAEELHEDNIVTFCNLSLFWHSQGSWRISYLHKGNACQLLHIIGIGPQTSSRCSALESEIHRRRFWACYLFHCFSSEKLFRFEAIAEFGSLPLPWPDKDFAAGIAPSSMATIDNDVGTGSVFVELIRGLTLWCSVVSVVRSKEDNFTSRLQQIYRVENDISTWWQRVPSDMKIEVTDVPIVEQRELPKILLVNLVYHQSLCALHSSIVPLFCWSKGDSTYSSAGQVSAQVAYEHSCSISDLIRSVLATDCPISAMPLFVAYAAYSSCAVQIPFLWCSEVSVKQRARANVESNINMIQQMSSYWKLASLLQVYARCLHEMHKRNQPVISNEPRYTDGSVFYSFNADLLAAKSSILEFTGILRSGDNGYVKPGEESRDLSSIQPDSTTVPQSPNHGVDRHFESHTTESRPSGKLQARPDTPCTNMEQQQVVGQLNLGGNEWPTLDMFGYLLDADMTSLLPMGENVDFSFLNTDMTSWGLGEEIQQSSSS